MCRKLLHSLINFARYFAAPIKLAWLFAITIRIQWTTSWVNTAMVFRYKGRLVNSQQKCLLFFCLSFIFTCRLVLYLYKCAVENLEISGFWHQNQSSQTTISYKLQAIDILTWYFYSKVVNIRFHKYFIKSSSKQNVIIKNEKKKQKLNIKFTISPKYKDFCQRL